MVLEREPSQRALFLAEVCHEDEELRREAESLIARATIDPATLDDPPEELAATVVGRYHLLQKIGEGGMGEVWLAEQKEPVRRRVALKLVKAGMNTREVMARFESERQALALMEHPAIAKVYDAGSTSEGAPYFVMEYVAGVTITDYCDNHRLPIKERLELFMQVCEGVRHAHQKAVIHRDLKPSNILVMEVDGRAAPKIIDFGVAKALSQKLTLDTIFTRVGSLIGTPEYMSPEQALSSGEDVDTRTDVYSLGIIFYELLAGAPPIELRRLAFDEYLRRLRDEDPPKPSTKIRTGDAATTTELARRRRSEPGALAKQIGGDLDSIALKALEKDRSRRYSSAADFAADIARYLRDEAVQAVAPSAAYRARKFASRHRWGVVMACAFVVVLTAAAAISIRQSIRASREAEVADAVSNFLRNDVLAQASASTQASPSTKPDPHLEVRTALDRAAARISGKFDKQPEVEAAIRDTIAQTYYDLGLYPDSRTQLERAHELYQQTLGPENQKTLATARNLGELAVRQGRAAEGEIILTKTIAIQRRVLGPEDSETLASMGNLATAYYQQGQFAKADALGAEVLTIQRRALGPENPSTLKNMHNLALTYFDEGKYEQAEKLDKEVIEVRRRTIGAEHPDTLTSMGNLALMYNAEAKYAEAEQLDSQVIEAQRRILGPDHSMTLQSVNNLAVVYMNEGKFAQAEALDREVFETRRRVLGPEHPDTLQSMHNVGWASCMLGKYEAAESLLSQATEIRRRVLGPEHTRTLLSAKSLANVYIAEGKFAQAKPILTETLEISRRTLGPENTRTIATLDDLGHMYQRGKDYADAEAVFSQALAGQRHKLGSQNPLTMSEAVNLALAYVSDKKFTEAEPLAREALDLYQKKQPDDGDRFRAESLLGASLAGQKKYAEAEPLLVEGYQRLSAQRESIGAPYRFNVDLAHGWLMQMYADWGKPEKAAEWRKK